MNKIKFIIGSLFGVSYFLPAFAFAQNVDLMDLDSLLGSVRDLMDTIVPILIGLAIIAFLWGVLKFVFNAGDEGKRSEGKMFMIYGIVGIVVMVSVWGLVAFVQNTFGIDNSGPVDVPQLPN